MKNNEYPKDVTMVKSFDEWLKEQNQPASNFLRRETYEAGQQSKQAEIDQLQRKLDTEKSLRSMSEHLNSTKQAEVDEQFIANCKQTDHIHKLQREKDELRKRIDEALKFSSDANSDLNIGMLKIAEILKGDQS